VPSVGDVLDGRYRIDAVIGRGGTSIVYRATHVMLEQECALKVLSPAAARVPDNAARLAWEARVTARLRSQHVARVLDAGTSTESGLPYLAMELLKGEDLAAVLASRGRLPVRSACSCIASACEALATAHARGIVHRDLKPANLFLARGPGNERVLKVLDFGISREVGVCVRESLTDPGTVLGTPLYMAPEQMESSAAVDPRMDVWALGAILFELLVGEPPFEGENLLQIFVRILRSRAPRPSARRPGVPPEVDAVVARCLALDPDARFASARDLGVALESALALPRRVALPRLHRALGPVAFVAGLAVVALLGGEDAPAAPASDVAGLVLERAVPGDLDGGVSVRAPSASSASRSR
jgi:serine/threonine protein kinase